MRDAGQEEKRRVEFLWLHLHHGDVCIAHPWTQRNQYEEDSTLESSPLRDGGKRYLGGKLMESKAGKILNQNLKILSSSISSKILSENSKRVAPSHTPYKE